MLSKENVKFIQSLRLKKQRDIHQQFIIEGNKLVVDFLNSDWEISHLLGTTEWIAQIPARVRKKPGQITEISDNELKRLSSLKTPNQVLAVVRKPEYSMNWEEIISDLSIVLDKIQDPGNFGTILRIAAWFGIKNVICSLSTVDLYNPKVIQATMGALLHVKIHSVDLVKFLTKFSETGLPVYGTDLHGKNIYESHLKHIGIIIFGNESRGICDEYTPFVSEKIGIPGFGPPGKKIESLNVAVAAAVVCSEFMRRKMI
jgi:TrmH family RNA methyltransferase